MAKVKSRRALGRGLSSLIPVDDEPQNKQESSENPPEGSVQQINRTSITPNPFQPRLDFDDEEIQGLAQSIETQGLLQPLVVRKTEQGYQIVSGERRFRAMTSLQWDKIPCIVKTDVSDRKMLEMAIVENVQRENLNEIEKAIAYQRLLQECDLSHEELSKQVGKSRTAVTNTMRLLKLSEDVQNMVRSGRLGMGHARALIALDSPEKQESIAQKIIDEGLSVREVEKMLRPTENKPPKKTPVDEPAADPNLSAVVDRLQYKLGTSVKMAHGESGKGKIEISYFSLDDMNRIIDILLV